MLKTIFSDEQEFLEAIGFASSQPLVVVDTEYQKREQWGAARIIGVSWGYPLGSEFHSFYAPFRHGEFPTTKNLNPSLIEEFNRFTGTQIYHNYIADYTAFLHDGVDISTRYIFDTMVASHLINENEMSFSLDSLSLKYFKARKLSLRALEKEIGWDSIHPLLMGDYACTDVILTYRQYIRCKAALQHQNLENLYDDYEKFIKSLAKIVHRGLHIDINLAMELKEEGERELNQLEQKLGFKPSSQQKVAHYLHDTMQVPVRYLTKGKAPSTSNLHLRRYSDLHPEVKPFVSDVLQYRTTYKAVTTWYQGFLDKRGTDGLLHPGLTVVGGGDDDSGGTVTGRLSCRQPNLQQIPRKGRARELFIDPPDHRLIEFDLSQAELRTIGYYLELLGDSTVADAYRKELDIHSISAEKMSLMETLPYKDARQVGKTCNFSLCYRAGPKQLQTILYRDGGLDVELSTASSWHQAWHSSYPGVRELNEKAEKQAINKGYVKMWNGRRRHLEGHDCYKAFNSIIQGGIGQVLLYIINDLVDKFPKLQLVNSVHDSVWVYIPITELDNIIPNVIQCMERIPTEQFGIPYTVDWKFYNEVH